MTKGKWTDKVQASDFERMVKRGLSAIGPFLEGEAIVRTDGFTVTGRLRGSITYAIKTEQDEITWVNLIDNCKKIDWTEFTEEDDNTTLSSEKACSGGACLI